MRFPKLVLSSLLMFAALSVATVEAQECVNGQCFRTPVRSGLAKAGQAIFGNQYSAPVSSFRVGGYDSDGMLITSIGTPTPAPAVPEATGSAQSFSATPPVIESSRRERKTSRQAILEAAKTAHDDCRIDSQQLMLIRVATLSPRLMKAVEEQLASQAIAAGYKVPVNSSGEVSAQFNWDSLLNFLNNVDWAKIAEFIATLIKLFA